jgi:hypothetical protein
MNNYQKKLAILVALLFLTLACFSACSNTCHSIAGAQLQFSLPSPRQASDLGITKWSIVATGPGGYELKRSLHLDAETVVFPDLALGDWSFTLNAIDSEHQTIASGTTKHCLGPGPNTVSINLAWLEN